MAAIIEGFKKEHSEIIEELKKVEELGIITKRDMINLCFYL
jgi:hypothetical protein